MPNNFQDVKYRRLRNDSYVTEQFVQKKKNIPWKAIIFAGCLCIMGFSLLIFGVLIVSGLVDIKYADRTWSILILGTLMFLPGIYHIRIAYYAFLGKKGFSFDEIPEFE